MEFVPSAEFQRKIGHYQDKALMEPVVVTRNGRERLVLLSAIEYHRLKRFDRQVLSVNELSNDDLQAIAAAEVPAEYAYLDNELEWLGLRLPLPEPNPGLVLRYAYLWHNEHLQGTEEGRKDRPCVVVLSSVREHGNLIVTVAPITHTPPHQSAEAIEIPLVTKQRLGLDIEQSWIIVSEVNRFLWPGPDLRPADPSNSEKYTYGYLPPGLFRKVKQSLITMAHALKLKAVQRTE